MASTQTAVNETASSPSRSYQTGHATNVANFDSLISFVSGYGAVYNPGNLRLKPEALQTLSQEAKAAMSDVGISLSAYTRAVTLRQEAFAGFDKYVTGILYLLKAMGTSNSDVADALTYIRKLKGMRAVPKKSTAELQVLAEENKEVKYNSVSQMGYDSRLENFGILIAILSEIPNYTPNEQTYTLAGMTAKLEEMKVKNADVIAKYTQLSNSRLIRNKILYDPETGLYKTSANVKNYARALFGLNASEYHQIRNIVFTNKF